MPYSSTKELPKAVKGLPGHARRIFRAAFNSAYRQYNGDETRAFKVAWAGVKTKYRKSGNQWVAKQDARGETSMKPLMEPIRSLYQRYLDQAPMGDLVNAKEALDFLDQAAGSAQPDLKRLEETCVVPVGFDLEQDYNYNRYRETSVGGYGAGNSTGHHNDFPGSLQHRIRTVCHALRENEDTSEYLGTYGFVLAVYPDYLVTCALDDFDDDEADYWRIAYTWNDSDYSVTFGDAEPVDVGTIVVPHGTMSHETYEEEDAEQAQSEALFKTDNGQKFSKSAYLIIGDPKLPSTWKIRVEETPGKKTVAQLGRAYAALTKGFRGNKVSASAEDKAAALSKLKGLYKSLNAPFPGAPEKQSADEDLPDWLKQGMDPPGGEEELVQSQSYILQAEGYDEASKVLKVSGVATTANVINSKKQVYPMEVWQDNLPRLERLLSQGKLVGESEHPADGYASLDRTCIKFTRLFQDGNQLKFEADILPTEPFGKNLQILIQNGVAVDISSRGRGTTKVGEWNGVPGVAIVQRGFRCDGFDGVVAGASPGSTITDWAMAQSKEDAARDTQGEEEMNEALQAQLDKMTALGTQMEAFLAKMNQDGKTEEKPAEKAEEKPLDQTAQKTAEVDATIERLNKAVAAQELALVRGGVEPLVQQVQTTKGWGPQWGNILRKRLQQGIEGGTVKTLEDLHALCEKGTEEVAELFQAAPKYPGKGHMVQPDKGDRGFKTPNELIDALCQGLSDEVDYENDPRNLFGEKDENGKPIIPGSFRTPYRQCKKMLQNIATHVDEVWNGRAAMQRLLLMTQGYGMEQVDDFLNQACADGTTSVGAGGAPSSAIFIFPLVRRVFPQLIATELASVQPMDRPDGKIFYLDAYRVDTGVDSVDEGGNTVSNRMRIDRSDSFSDSYANDPGECNTANLIQLRLSSKSVTADNKKLFAQWTIEEMQDLRAYHGLDAALELTGSLSREIALEWNQIVLKELLNGATAGNRTFGTTAPSGYTQKEWDEYITRYIDALSNDIFKKRHGDLTHIIAGPDAWLKLAAAFRVGTNPRSGPEPEQYAGLTLTPFMAASMPNVRTFKTSFWSGVNTNKVLVLRRGSDWSDTPYVWAPYMDYVSPTLTLPDVFTQKQGIMSRVAHKMVVSDAAATLTIAAATGVAL